MSLPAAIMLYELCFGQRRCKRDWLPALPFIAVAALIPLYHVGSALLASFQTAPAETVNQVAALTQETKAISRLDYIFTEFRVLVTYLRLLVLPVNQTLDYDYPVYHSLFQLPVLLSFLTLSALGLSAILSFRRCRIWTFAVFWFFITLSVESGLIPIMDVIYEHRLYPAVLAYALLLPWGLEWLLGRIKTSGF